MADWFYDMEMLGCCNEAGKVEIATAARKPDKVEDVGIMFM